MAGRAAVGIDAARIAARAAGTGDIGTAVEAGKLAGRMAKGAIAEGKGIRKDIERRRKK
jgi:hypothetical protein